MKKNNANLILVLVLCTISMVLYVVQLFVFHSLRDTSFYFLQDMAFLPLQAAIVTLVLNRVISFREKQERLRKMNMAINAFFSDAGTELVYNMNRFMSIPEDIAEIIKIEPQWAEKDFQKAEKRLSEVDLQINSRNSSLEELKKILTDKRMLFLNMLQNSTLLEHDTFSDMLWAVFHIMDELVSREDLQSLPSTDLDHLSIDIKRAYRTLLIEWIHYLGHLKTDYPYLFSLAIRKNPFDDGKNVVIE